jgi:drug/metabolite transporter (DMT)-like permease
MQFKTYLMIFVMVVANPLGNILLAKGMKQVGPQIFIAPSWHSALQVFSTPSIWLGIAFLMVFFAANLLVLTWADYSFVQPACSIAYVVVSLLSVFLLGETISPLRWLGIAVICLGVYTIGRTNPRTAKDQTNA